MVPVTIGLGLINFNLTLDLSIATLVPGGHAAAYLNYAFRLFMLPQGLFSVAVSAVLFPASRGWPPAATWPASRPRSPPARGRSCSCCCPRRRSRSRSPSRSPASSSSTASSRRRTRTHVATTLVAFSLGLVGNGVALLLTRAFFALQMPQVPTRVAVGNLFLNAVLDLAFYKPFGAAGHRALDGDRDDHERPRADGAPAPPGRAGCT